MTFANCRSRCLPSGKIRRLVVVPVPSKGDRHHNHHRHPSIIIMTSYDCFRGNILARIAATIGRLPSESPHVPFTGSVRVTPNHDQVWTRTFGTQVFSTTMTVGPDQEGENQSRPILYEKHGPITCAYQIKVTDRVRSICKSEWDLIRFAGGVRNQESLVIWNPTSELVVTIIQLVRSAQWYDRVTLCPGQMLIHCAEDGWMFHGKLEAPIVGLLMEYKGSFVVHKWCYEKLLVIHRWILI